MQGGAGGRGAQPPQDSIPTHIWDIGFGIGVFGIQVLDLVICDIGLGFEIFGM